MMLGTYALITNTATLVTATANFIEQGSGTKMVQFRNAAGALQTPTRVVDFLALYQWAGATAPGLNESI